MIFLKSPLINASLVCSRPPKLKILGTLYTMASITATLIVQTPSTSVYIGTPLSLVGLTTLKECAVFKALKLLSVAYMPPQLSTFLPTIIQQISASDARRWGVKYVGQCYKTQTAPLRKWMNKSVLLLTTSTACVCVTYFIGSIKGML